MIELVIFDLDDTLYQEYDYVDQAFRSVAEVLFQKLQERGQDTPNVNNIHRYMRELLEANGRGKIFDDICEKLGIQTSIKELVEVYRATKPVLHLYPDAEQLFYYLEGHHIKTGLITDGCSQVQHAKIEALQLDRKCDVVLATDDLGADEAGKSISKPNPCVYQWVLERANCKPEHAIYIGDNPNKDFIGAKALGMKTARIVRPEGDHMLDVVTSEFEADDTIHNLLEVIDLL